MIGGTTAPKKPKGTRRLAASAPEGIAKGASSTVARRIESEARFSKVGHPNTEVYE